MALIDAKWIVNLKGKSYPMWAGVLDAATEAGLQSLTTRVVQIPTTENGMLAVVSARAEFKDGRVFEDVGDCSPQSTSPQLAAAALRLASTRAKGRALRDAINVGQTMFEELPEGTGDDERPARSPQKAAESPAQPSRAAAATERHDSLEAAQRARDGERPSDQGIKAPPARAGDGTQTKCADCGCDLTTGQVRVSTGAYGQPLCPTDQKKHARLAA